MKKTLKSIVSVMICLSILTCGYSAAFPSAVIRSNAFMNTELLSTYSRLHVHNDFTVEDMRGQMDVYSTNGWDIRIHRYDKTTYNCRNLYITDYADIGRQNVMASYTGYIEGSQVGFWYLP